MCHGNKNDPIPHHMAYGASPPPPHSMPRCLIGMVIARSAACSRRYLDSPHIARILYLFSQTSAQLTGGIIR